MNNWPVWKEKLEHPLVEGGLRLIGTVKKGTLDHPLISYVTVVRNNPHTLARAIESVQRQGYDNIEHIIIDGASTDNTLDVIKSYESKIDYYASEPDKGIYDALNKAIELCHGQLILVLNSDDWLTNNSAELAASHYIAGFPQFISGSAMVHAEEHESTVWKPKKITHHSYFSVANLNHNSVYASRETYELTGPYDSSFRIAGDFKWIMACFEVGVKFVYIDEILTNYSLGGISSDNNKHYEEYKRIIREKFSFLKENEIAKISRIHYPFIRFKHQKYAQLFLFIMVVKYMACRKNFVKAIYSDHDLNNKTLLGRIYFSFIQSLDK